MTNNAKLTILQINDTHGYLEPHPESFWSGDQAEYRPSGGYARLPTIFKQVRRERSGRYGAPITPGPVMVNDLWNIVPPNPPVSTVELTGREIWDMIEDNLEHTLAADPNQQMGGYVKRCLGLTLYVKLENPAGSRIQQIFTGDEELERNKTYTAAFVTTQGVPKNYGRNRHDLDLRAIDALKRYCVAHPSVNAALRGTVIAV